MPRNLSERDSGTHLVLLLCFLTAILAAACSQDGSKRVTVASEQLEAAFLSLPGASPDATAPSGAEPREDAMNYTAFHRLVEARRSIREFTSKDVSDADITRILEAVRLSPTAGNLQAYEVVVVRKREHREALAAASYGQEWVEQAPVVLAFVALPAVSAARYGERGSKLYAVQDATIATTYAMLAASALGLGSVWIGAFDTRSVARVLECRAGEVPVALLPIGYPAESPEPRPRRSVQELSRHL